MDQTQQAMIDAYTTLHSTVDRIATSAELREKFRDLLPPEINHLCDDELLRRLMNLRKSGHLPRHFRGV